MAAFINYFWQSFFCLGFFFGIYWVFLRNEKTFRFNRIYLLLTPALALLFPLVEIPVSFDKPSISLENTQLLQSLYSLDETETIGTIGLPEFTVTDTKLPILWEMRDYFFAGYLMVVFFLAFKLFWQYLLLRQLELRGWYQTKYKLKGAYFLIPTFGLAPVFSYFDKLFWDDTQKLTQEEESQIIRHELEHIHQKHSWDVMYYQVLSILFWFNPIIHLMRMALVDLHEYLADEKVLGSVEDKSSYPKLIVKMAFKGLDLPIGNYFIRSTTLKRIIMMKKSAKINWFKLVMVVPLTAMLFGLVSMKTEKGLAFLTNHHTLAPHAIKQQVLGFKDSLDIGISVRTLKRTEHYEKIGSLEEGTLRAQLGELEYVFTGISSDDEYLKVRELIQILRANSQTRKSYENAYQRTAVEKEPKPENGWKELEEFLRSHVNVPEKVQELGLSGVVELEFLVKEDGKIHYPVIRRSFGAGIDEQVLQALTRMDAPKWEPGLVNGKSVSVIMNFPVGFNFTKQNQQAASFFPRSNTAMRLPAPSSIADDEVFEVVESMPVPAGGMEGWNNYVSENLKYPERAKQGNVQGTVYVVFVVDREGNVTNPEILRGIGAGCDEEALRLVQNSPRWTPGIQSGQLANVQIRIPIRFKLPDSLGTNSSFDELVALNQDRQLERIVPTDEFNKHLQKNLKYPTAARQTNTTGTVLTKLVFDKNGKITDYEVVKGISEELNEEAIRYFKNAPNWNVKSMQDGYQAIYPVKFKLNGIESHDQHYERLLGTGVVVVGYGAASSLKSGKVAQGEVMTIRVVNEKIVNLGGEILTIDGGLSKAIASLLKEHDLDPKQITARFEAEPEVKMGTIQDVQTALRQNDINRILYTISSHQDNKPINSLPHTQSNQPLVILDGKIGVSLDSINPSDIESISVIKDAATIKLYGDAAKNGAIIITSKK
ncbi:TonB family protein [Lunatimonas lonarensis]|uniref:TonB family protein n=1 Tax=Lunatimonas lonarensis TaxID=1232681 RepID=R7ZVM8_9BACT|nr:TonB family protein [Lunatimonas lonarensis]EON78195.1 TonB family protein [Lunatimonas lonarensis]